MKSRVSVELADLLKELDQARRQVGLASDSPSRAQAAALLARLRQRLEAFLKARAADLLEAERADLQQVVRDVDLAITSLANAPTRAQVIDALGAPTQSTEIPGSPLEKPSPSES